MICAVKRTCRAVRNLVRPVYSIFYVIHVDGIDRGTNLHAINVILPLFFW